MIKLIEHSKRLLILLAFPFLTTAYSDAHGQQKTPMVRLAKIVVDSSRLEDYKAALKEQVQKSVQIEPGVLTLYAVSEKENPTYFTILEFYADSAAYKAHLQTPHFIKYKTSSKDMVKSLELIEADPLIPEMLIKASTTNRKR